jgi:hypothetical protein
MAQEPSKEIAPREYVNVITQMLADAGHERPAAWEVYLTPELANSTNNIIQRIGVNTAWRQILGRVSTESTMDARFTILDVSTYDEWVTLFKQGTLPTILRLKLPL